MASYDYLKDKGLRERLKKVRNKRPTSNTLSKKIAEKNLSQGQSRANSSRVNSESISQAKTSRDNSGSSPSRKRYPKPSTKDLAISTKQLA